MNHKTSCKEEEDSNEIEEADIETLKQFIGHRIVSFETRILGDGFNIVFDDDTRLELYCKDLSWCIEKKEK